MDPSLCNASDHKWVHGFVYDAVCALEWTFHRRDNPFGWKGALMYYKQAMEIPCDAEISVVRGVSGVSAFRDPDIPVSGIFSARSVYLGKAFRALGETMHMFGDMVLPPHVRNDSHPWSDPKEDSVRLPEVQAIFAGEYTGGEMLILQEVRQALDNLDAEGMFDYLARFTNENFYSNDTIYDEPAGIPPRNGQPPYPRPQFADLRQSLSASSQHVLGREFEGHWVPMIQETLLSSHMRRVPGLSRVARMAYHIPPSFAVAQSAILIPLAVYANARLTDLLFPTLLLHIDTESMELPSNEATQVFKIRGQLEHRIDEDPEWKRQEIAPILYCGPGELWIAYQGIKQRIAYVVFRDGQLFDLEGQPLYLTPTSALRGGIDWWQRMGAQPPPFFSPLPIPERAEVFLVVEAGARRIVSRSIVLASEKVETEEECQEEKEEQVEEEPLVEDRVSSWVLVQVSNEDRLGSKGVAGANHVQASGEGYLRNGGLNWEEWTWRVMYSPIPNSLVPGRDVVITVSATSTHSTWDRAIPPLVTPVRFEWYREGPSRFTRFDWKYQEDERFLDPILWTELFEGQEGNSARIHIRVPALPAIEYADREVFSIRIYASRNEATLLRTYIFRPKLLEP